MKPRVPSLDRETSMPIHTLCVCVLLCCCPSPDRILAAEPEPPTTDLVSRGEYLVHHVAMCSQCHSPRSPAGELVTSKLLLGGRIPTQRPYAGLPWAISTPRLAGLPGYDQADIVALLTEGRRPESRPPRPPMPPFRMKQDDAQAIAAYLDSLDP
jgi:mono/diheme cytochrome c family protein